MALSIFSWHQSMSPVSFAFARKIAQARAQGNRICVAAPPACVLTWKSMDIANSQSVSELPDEMLSFVLAQREAVNIGPRLGRLITRSRTPLQTPHYVANTSRGVVPHISHDVLRKHTWIRGVYIALEDCM